MQSTGRLRYYTNTAFVALFPALYCLNRMQGNQHHHTNDIGVISGGFRAVEV